jgi:hypothetical protein
MGLLTPPALTPGRIRLARIIAVAADALQIMILPAVIEGFLSPINNAIDLTVAAALIYLIGWHWAFLPTFLTELVPIVDLAPTWTIAIFVATGIGGPVTKDIAPADASSTPATPVTPVVVEPPERSGPPTPPASQP